MPGPKSGKAWYEMADKFTVDYRSSILCILWTQHKVTPSFILFRGYMFALAREMGTVPRLWPRVFRHPLASVAIAFGPTAAPIFRLDGPYASDEAMGICSTELLRYGSL